MTPGREPRARAAVAAAATASPFPPRPSGPRIIASPVGFPARRSLIGLRRKPLLALLGIKLNIWAPFPLGLLSFLLSPFAKKPKTNPRKQATLTSPGTESYQKRKPKVVLSRGLAELLSGTYPKHRTLPKRPGPETTPGAERRLSAGGSSGHIDSPGIPGSLKKKEKRILLESKGVQRYHGPSERARPCRGLSPAVPGLELRRV